jgi:hypothetical protein
VVDDVRLTPARAARAGGRGRVLGHPRVQEQELERAGGHGVRERTHALQVREFEREELHGVLRAVVRHGLERGAEGGDVARAEDEAVAVRALGEQLLERFEALGEIVSGGDSGGMLWACQAGGEACAGDASAGDRGMQAVVRTSGHDRLSRGCHVFVV